LARDADEASSVLTAHIEHTSKVLLDEAVSAGSAAATG
jgi:hypothetical protein